MNKNSFSRNKVQKMISDLITYYRDNSSNNNSEELLTNDIIKQISENIEQGCFEFVSYELQSRQLTQNFKRLYNIYMRKLLYNLDITSEVDSDYLIIYIVDLVKINDFESIKQIVRLPSDKMNPNALKKEREYIYDRLNVKLEQKVSQHIKCRKCKQYSVTYTTHQYRASDEPAGKSCTCINPECGYQWSETC